VRTLEAERRQVLWGSVSMGAKEDKSSTWHIWAAGFHHVTARSRLAGILEFTNHLFVNFTILGGCGELRITDTTDTESADMGACLYVCVCVSIYIYTYLLTPWSRVLLDNLTSLRS
jgi:hypothetical protein